MDYKLLGTRIRERRLQSCISQETLAEVIHVSSTYVGAMERARKRPSLTTLVKLANALGTTTDFLLYGNLRHDTAQYKSEFNELLRDCSPYERHILITFASAVKSSLRQSINLLRMDYD